MSWATASFQDVVRDVSRRAPKKLKTSEFLSSGRVPIIDQGASAIAGYWDDPSDAFEVEIPVVIFGDHTKHLKFVEQDFCVGADGVKILEPVDRLDPKFLFHYLHTIHIPDAGYSRHFKYLKEAKIPLPPLDEQKRIAAILDKADALRQARRRAITRLDDLAQSIFYEMFGDWRQEESSFPIVELGDHLSFLTSGSRGWAKFYAEDGEAAFIRIQNVGRGSFDVADLARVSPPDNAEARRTAVQAGDVLLSITADLGRAAVVPGGLGPAHINQHLTILRSEDFEPEFLAAAITSPSGQHFVQKRNREAVKAGLNFDDVKSIKLILPKFSVQQAFVERVQRARALASKAIASRSALDLLFASLQQRAFRGEL